MKFSFFILLVILPLVLWFSYLDLFWVSPWNYLVIFLLILFALILLRINKFKAHKLSQAILTIPLLFVVLIALIDLSFINIARMLVVILFAFLIMFFVRDQRQVLIFINVLLGLVSISALVAIFQFVGLDFFWQMREIFGFGGDELVKNQILQRERITGLAYYVIPLSYQLAVAVPLLFWLIIQGAKSTYLKFCFVVCLLALFMTLIKSAILGGVAGIVLVLFFSKRFNLGNKIIASMLILFVLSGFLLFNYSDIRESILSRRPLLIVSQKIAVKNPFGVGSGQFNQQASEIFSEVQDLPRASYVLTTSTHNHFLNILLYYGILGLMLILIFYYFVFKGLFFIKSQGDPIVIGLIASFVAYIIHSMFHNAGPFLGEPVFWLLVGIVLFLLKQRIYANS